MFNTEYMYKCTELFVLFCRGNTPDTKGTAFVVYEDIFDAKNACDHLSGFNVCNRYLVVLYYQATKVCWRPITEVVKLRELYVWIFRDLFFLQRLAVWTL